jgi:hypothetical protein
VAYFINSQTELVIRSTVIFVGKLSSPNTVKAQAFSFLFLLMFQVGQAQSADFQFVFGSKALKIDSSYVVSQTQISIETIRFYVSGVALYKGGSLVWKEAESYHLIDALKTESLRIATPEVDADKMVFLIGTDSLTNVSGAMGGDLDPSKGMYWAWNSGYINFKLEGTSSVCDTRNNAFQFHLGGYAYPNSTVQSVELERTSNTILVDVKAFLEGIDLANDNTVMSPGQEAVTLAKRTATIFRMKNEE